MNKIKFYKFQASGNDFILIDHLKNGRTLKGNVYKTFAKKYCQRKLNVGADGLLVIVPSKKGSFKMRIFNSDGTEAEMCGNGARCAALWARLTKPKLKTISFETKAGIIESEVCGQKCKEGNLNSIKIKMIDPFDLKLNIKMKVLDRDLTVNFINTGVPHIVVFVNGLKDIDVNGIGSAIRFHPMFKPAGTNVNFVEVINDNLINIRTYERGVEGETLACGTGATASALIFKSCQTPEAVYRQKNVNVQVKSGEKLKVYFNKDSDKINNVWLEGKGTLVYKGEISI